VAYKKKSIKEIAQMAGVSPSAVSFAIHDRNGISDATKEKILSVIKENDYHPNAASQRMTLGKSFNIALIYPAAASPFFDLFYYEVANGLTEELTANLYNVVFIPLKSNGNDYELPHIIKRQDADGVILLHETPVAMLDEFDGLGVPYVLVDWQYPVNNRTNISLDCEHSTYRATRYLVEKGHTQVAFWGADKVVPQYYLRCFTGYQKAMSDMQLPIYPGWINNSVHDVESAVQCIQSLSSLSVQPTAVCCMNDMCAINSIHAASLAGVRVPDDLSFIGIDALLLGEHINPKLTTISYQKSKIGKTAAKMLLRMIAGEEVESVVINSDDVIERQSVLEIL